MVWSADTGALALKAFASKTDIAVKRVSSIWTSPECDSPLINPEARRIVDRKVAAAAKGADSVVPGLPVVGPAGSGKTHLLSYLRQRAMEAGGLFILGNMEIMRDFWDTMTHSLLASLDNPGAGGAPQMLILAGRLAALAGAPEAPDFKSVIFAADAAELGRLARGVYKGLRDRGLLAGSPKASLDLIRALIFRCSGEPELADAGTTWLQDAGGRDPDPEAASFGFRRGSGRREDVLAGITSLASLGGGFTVVGLDQLDGVLMNPALSLGDLESDFEGPEAEAGPRAEALARVRLARLAVGDLALGLASLINEAASTLVVAATLADGWGRLTALASGPARERFEPRPVLLEPLTGASQAKDLVVRRLAPLYAGAGLAAPYPSWPFPERLFEAVEGMSPRELLRAVDAHLEACLAADRVFECESLARPEERPPAPSMATKGLAGLEERFRAMAASRSLAALTLAEALETLVAALVQGFAPEGEAQMVLGDYGHHDHKSGRHVFEYLRYHSDPDSPPDRSLSLWVIDHAHPRSFQSRLKAALDQSGADPRIPERRLGVIRSAPLPSGAVTARMIRDFERAGGLWLRPSEEDLAVLAALRDLAGDPPPEHGEWLRGRQPAFEVAFAAPLLAWLIGRVLPAASGGPPESLPEPPAPAEPIEPTAKAPVSPDSALAKPAQAKPSWPPAEAPRPAKPAQAKPAPEEPIAPRPRKTAAAPEKPLVREDARLVIGSAIDPFDGSEGAPVSLERGALARHCLILGATGTGKTLTLKRLIDEAALSGVPSIVLDRSGDLCLLGRGWDSPPPGWLAGDAERAQELFRSSRTVIWTPGASKGNPLNLKVIPDLGDLGDPDARSRAIEDTVEVLAGLVGKKVDQTGRAVLKKSLERLSARRPSGGLEDLVRILGDPPAELLRALFPGADRLARDLAVRLKAAILNKPELDSEDSVDVMRLLEPESGLTRVNVIYLGALGSAELERSFAARLVDRLFRGISRESSPDGRLKGLLVIDEAKELVPGIGVTVAKEPVIRIINQSRKFGLGVLMASQEFRSVDHRAAANCETLLVGRQNSLTAAKNAAEHLGGGLDASAVSSLDNFRFLLKTPGGPDGGRVRQIKAAFGLSRHDQGPPAQDRIIEMAAESASKA